MKRILQIFLFLSISVAAGAQALPFVAADYSSAALSKAGAVATDVTSTAMSAFGNIAAVPYSDKTADFALGYTSWQPGFTDSDVIYAGGTYKLTKDLAVSAGAVSGMYQKYDIVDDSGLGQGSFKPSELQLKVGAAYRLLPFLSAGVGLGYASSSLTDQLSYGALMADVFLMSRLGGLKVALGVSDLGSAVLSETGNRYSLPTAVTLGLGYDKELIDNHKIDLAFDADCYVEGAFAASVGAEYIFKDMISVNAGYRYGGKSVIPSYASLGLGCRLCGIGLELAYILPMAEVPMSNTLSVAVGYSF